MPDLISRVARLQIDTLLIEFGGGAGLDIEFEALRTATPEANTARVAVYNLSPQHRKAITDAAAKTSPSVRLEAGYRDACVVVFDGDFDLVNVTRRGPDVVTELTLRDGAKTMATAALVRAYKARTQLSTVLKDLAEATSLGLGNLSDVVAEAQISGVGRTLAAPFALNGNAYQALQRLAAAAGLEVSVQGKRLQFVAIGGALKTRAVVLSPTSGLVGSPAVAVQRKHALPGQTVVTPGRAAGSVLKAKCLIMPGLDPGQQIQVKAENVDGAYTIRRTHYIGETAGTQWYADLEAVPVV